MAPNKRDDDSVSPPPLKRRRRSSEATAIEWESSISGGNHDSSHHRTMSYPAPASSWLRIFSWNVNGISPFLQPSVASYMKPAKSSGGEISTNSLRSFLRRHHWPQILHLQEVKITPSDESTCRAIERAVNTDHTKGDQGPSYTVRFCLPRDKFNAKAFGGKIYGVATVIRDDFLGAQVTETREVDWDLEGRILVVETRSKLCLFNIYAVNGTSNPYRSPVNGTPAGTRHDRKLQFHKHLLAECKELESRGYRVVLAGDLNVAPARMDGHPNLRTKPEQHVRNRVDFNEKFLDQSVPAGLGAIDSFRHLHPTTRRYTYIPRNVTWGLSCDRVDMILLSGSLLSQHREVLKEADILMTEAERGPSDHVPLFVSLDLDQLGAGSSQCAE